MTGGNIMGGVKNDYLEASAWGWQMDPVGYQYFLHLLYDRYQVPLFDVENGLGTFDKVDEDGKVRGFQQIVAEKAVAGLDETGVMAFKLTGARPEYFRNKSFTKHCFSLVRF